MGRNILGIVLMIVGFLICAFGGIGLAIKAFYEIAEMIDNETLTAMGVFNSAIWFILRDIIAWVVGIVLFVFGFISINKD